MIIYLYSDATSGLDERITNLESNAPTVILTDIVTLTTTHSSNNFYIISLAKSKYPNIINIILYPSGFGSYSALGYIGNKDRGFTLFSTDDSGKSDSNYWYAYIPLTTDGSNTVRVLVYYYK